MAVSPQFRLLRAIFLVFASVWSGAVAAHAAQNGDQVDHVIIISVDGLRPDATTLLPQENGRAFSRLLSAPHTLNARTTQTFTRTLPNHVSMVTSRPEGGPSGHDWEQNSTPPPGVTLHTNHGSYVNSVFDVAHDRGLSTAMIAGKAKFVLFPVSYDTDNGAPDLVGMDNGRNKIDVYMVKSDAMELADAALDVIEAQEGDERALVFLHFQHPDSAGHSEGWDLSLGSKYMDAVATVDAAIDHILDTIHSSVSLHNRVAVLLTADHGGGDSAAGHGIPEEVVNYTVPLFVWFCDEQTSADLYDLNSPGRTDPGNDQIEDPPSSAEQPIRAGEVGNIALDLLGLPPIPDSVYNEGQDLRVVSHQNRCVVDPQCETDADCDDGDPCTDDSCDELAVCVNEGHTRGCDDGDACTLEDRCHDGGACFGAPVDCSDFDETCAVGECDSVSGACRAVVVEVGTPCDDSDPCTLDDRCEDGSTCVGTAVDCSESDGACAVGECDPATGSCRAVVVEVDTPCDDSNPCTQSDACDAFGDCIGSPVECAPTAELCRENVCNPANGNCEIENAADETMCMPGSCMDATAVCVGGQCVGESSCDAVCERCRDNACESRCGFPISGGTIPVASDALWTLRAAVGAEVCLGCVCDVDGSQAVEATDALILLDAAVSVATEFACPGPADAPGAVNRHGQSTAASVTTSTTSLTMPPALPR